MSNFNSIRATRIIETCDNEIIAIKAMLNACISQFENNEMPANKLRKVYKSQMNRVAFYNKTSFMLSNKYGVERYMSIGDLHDIINYME